MDSKGGKVMRQGSADALATDEPYEGNLHVRVCGGAGWETAGPTRQKPAHATRGPLGRIRRRESSTMFEHRLRFRSLALTEMPRDLACAGFSTDC